MERRFEEVHKELQTKASAAQLDAILNAIDGINKRLDDDAQERAAMNSQLNRHDRWIHHLAHHTHAKLVPD